MLQNIIIHGSKVIEPKQRSASIRAEAAEVADSRLSVTSLKQNFKGSQMSFQKCVWQEGVHLEGLHQVAGHMQPSRFFIGGFWTQCFWISYQKGSPTWRCTPGMATTSSASSVEIIGYIFGYIFISNNDFLNFQFAQVPLLWCNNYFLGVHFVY